MTAVDPYLDAGMRGWIVTTARKNHRRIANYDVEDLIQEGYACYYKCRDRYVGKRPRMGRTGLCRFLPVNNPDRTALRHFQALVKTTFSNHITTLVIKQPSGWELPVSSLGREDQSFEAIWDTIIPPADEVASATVLLQNAPGEIKQLFQLLIDDALELTGYRRLGRRKHSARETTNEYYCRLLRIPPYDLVGTVEKYFLSA